ncbi:hypothetical protein [Mesorhizobium sp. BR-1-1-10]|uniref:hypothetical protein n=1 Tax=Mesorhizobium sp. BR-1-1-10 TaxID=2876660 RepID=UPI001CD18494|nr:hypothetical protein [Mesorhizobium sp. BR-1-1-10]MBZ9979186.1 hypothetical protein [Mesorhizobium sp. BR-1-1-10]
MVHIIPLSVGQRRLDTDNAPRYPQGSPVGGAMQGQDEGLSALAEHYRQMTERQEAFDAELARRRFNGQIALAEDEATANAPPDGAGLHEAMYGAVDPRNERAVKSGLFDTLFDAAVPGMPESQRANFARQKEAMRAVGARRMAQRQLQRRDDYELAEVETALKADAIAIGNADPDDHASFEAARQQGLDLIDKMGVDPDIKQQMVKDWFGTAAKTRFEALIAKDPQRALAMSGVGMPEDPSGGDTSGSVPWIGVSGSSDATAAKGDRIGKPDERLEQAFADSVPARDPIVLKPATGYLADLSPDDVRRLIDRAHAANTAQLIEARTNITLASQTAPDAIANTGIYAGRMPDPADFAAVYGTEEGGKQYQDFIQKIDIGRQAFGMRTMPNQAIHAALRDAEPAPSSSKEEQTRYGVTAAAALNTLSMRRADPAGYVRTVFPNVDAAWRAAKCPDSKPGTSDSEAYRWAIAVSVAAQRQLGIETPQPLPKAVVKSIADTFGNKDLPQGKKDIILHDLLAATPDPGVRGALSRQLDQASLSGPAQVDPIVNTATVQGRLPSAPPSEARSAFQRVPEDFGNYLSEGFEALGRVPHDIGLGLQDLLDSPLGFLEQLPATPGSGAVAEGRLALEAVGEAVAKGLAMVRGGTGKFAKPLEELAPGGSRATSELAAERAVTRQVVETKSLVKAAEDAAYRVGTGAKPDNAELLQIIKSIARDPSKVRYPGASFGKALSKNYRKTFLDANLKLEGKVVVHHAAEQQILNRYLGLVTEEEMHSLQNLRGIPKSLDNLLHNKIFRFEWDEFYASHPQPTRQQVLEYVEYIDKKYGHLFNPPIGE